MFFQFAEAMRKNSFHEATAERCAAKWKYMKERYQEIILKSADRVEGKQVWTYYEKMHSIMGSEATVTLDHVQEVGSCGGVKVKHTSNDSKPSKRQRTRVTNSESLDRLIGTFLNLSFKERLAVTQTF